MIRSIGLEIVSMKRVRLTREIVNTIWPTLLEKEFYGDFLKYCTSGDCVAFIVRGDDAINRLNDLVGHWDPRLVQENTIRHRFAASIMETIIHSTADEKTFWKEVALFY
jgi:nucleoside-diphosphate kinase